MEENRAASAFLGAVLDGSYRIEQLIGEGGMGAVYLATQLRLDKPVAIKVMARELASNQEALERFRREARVTSALGHPHIVQVFDFSATPAGEPFLVMELLEGEDLDSRLRRVARLPLKEVVHIVKQVASALAATHAKGIVHRDLKPGNIHLLEVAGEKDFVKVLDFGISKVRSATTKLTRTSSVIGTPNYMSPEQAKGKTEDIDESTDQWALACIAWECLSGEGPFVAENVPSILFQIVHEPPPSLLPKVAGLPPQIEDVLVRALSKNKADRFCSVTEFAEALAEAQTRTVPVPSTTAAMPGQTIRLPDVEEAAPLPPKTTTFTQTAGEVEADDGLDQLPRRPKWVLGAVAAGALVVVAGIVLTFRSGPAPKDIGIRPSPAQPTAVSTPEPAPPPQPAPKLEAPAAPAIPASSSPSQAVAGPVPAPAAPGLTDDTRKEQRHEGKRRGSPQELPFPSRSAVEAAPSPIDDPFQPSPSHQSLNDPFERQAKPTAPSLKKKEWPNENSAASKPTKTGPQRKIIEEL